MTQPGAARRLAVFALLASAVAVADQLSKAWVVATFPRPTEIVGDLLRIVIVRNTGGIFGLFGDSALLLAGASTIVIAMIVVYQVREGLRQHWLLSVALGLLLGGAIGNLIDRLRLGYVVDFVDAGIGGFRWYTFNVADSAISIAIVLLIAMAFFGERLAPRPAHESTS
ncbi:MAG TPA: signal peptidase II [Candidatus Limnocylindria bacterium]|nr:signal peptidase II [Candidatus Limnocylindria bacterium]